MDLPWYQLSLIRCCGEEQPDGHDSVQVPVAQTFESHANTLVLPSSMLHLKVQKRTQSCQLRLQRPAGLAKAIANYHCRATARVVLRGAAQAWSHGVPWEEAFRIAKEVDVKVGGDKGKGKGRGKAKGRGRG